MNTPTVGSPAAPTPEPNIPSAAPSTGGRFATLDAALIDQLRGIVGAGHVLVTDGDVEPCSRDATPLFRARPDAVVLPVTTAQVSAVLALASRHRIPVTPRGGGSNLAAATIPEYGGIVMVLTRMNQLVEVNGAELLAVAQAGATTAALADAAAARGLLYPLTPAAVPCPPWPATSRRVPAACAGSSTA